MAKLIMGVGIPGSGKTTVLRNIAKKHDYSYICPDDIRMELTGDAANQTKNKEVWGEAYRRLEAYLKEGRTVIFDATFSNNISRNTCLSLARKSGASKVQGLYVDTPLEIAKERNAGRDRVVPEFVLERMSGSLENNPPIIEEGFDSIFTLDEYHKLMKAELEGKEGSITKEFKLKIK